MFVTGISSNEVLMNGHIMPWRDVNWDPSDTSLNPTDKPECLRGEDLCFLYEGARRLRLLSSTYAPLQYTSSLSRTQINNVYLQVRNSGFAWNAPAYPVLSSQFEKRQTLGTSLNYVESTYHCRPYLSDMVTP